VRNSKNNKKNEIHYLITRFYGKYKKRGRDLKAIYREYFS